jgi:hypothetical protein
VCGFLGLAGYYRKFIKEFGSIVVPLTAEAEAAFMVLKTAVTTAPVLALPDFGQPFIVECDASTHGFGAILLQGQHPVSFFSRPVGPRH